MNRDDVIRMAIDAIGGDMNGQDVQHLAWRLKHFKDDSYRFGPDELLKFVAMIEAAEREACAMTVEEWLHGEWHNQGIVAAMMIRARGES
jgi:hypothetical protein